LVKRGCLGLLAVLVVAVIGSVAFAHAQARRTPQGEPAYVALGSSFAAGAGLGELQDGSPLFCARSVGGYPQLLARKLKLPIVDMSCGGAVTKHLLRGGQFFQGPQVRVIDKDTRLVTITAGGNDVGYVGDLSMLAARNTNSTFGRLVRLFWGGPKTLEQRGFETLQRELAGTIRDVRLRAPHARIVVATYPTILPPTGTCPRLSLSGGKRSPCETLAIGWLRSRAKRRGQVGRWLSTCTRLGRSITHARRHPGSMAGPMVALRRSTRRALVPMPPPTRSLSA